MISSYFIGPLIVSIISTLLALIIALVDKGVNNYGIVNISINKNKKVLKVNGGASLLSTLAEQKIFIPSACGGKGTCGVCKVKVISDIGPHLPTEIPLLNEDEIKNNTRLSCQVKVKNNIELNIPEELFAIRQFITKVSSIVDVTHDIKEVYLDLIEPASISFKAGQYAQLVIPPYGKIKDKTSRAYSMLSTPHKEGQLGFLIRLVPGGIATTYVHTLLNQGDDLEVIAPVGDFMLHDTDAVMLCIAGGSGMAPMHSILFDMKERAMTNREVWFFFGARNRKELFYTERFYNLEKEWQGFHFIPALSDPTPEDDWKGETGLITQVLDRYLKEQINPGTQREGYLCGSPGMINACIKVLRDYNIAEDKIYFDKFS